MLAEIMLRGFLQFVGIIGTAIFAVAAFFFAVEMTNLGELVYERSQAPATTTVIQAAVSSSTPPTTSSARRKSPIKKAAAKPQNPETPVPESAIEPANTEVRRIDNPYSFPPKASEILNQESRAALVNIFCQTSGGSIGAISGSGVMIDSRGVILTNAHVAQYVLIASQSQIGLECFIRAGAPAQARWKADILFMPAAWVHEHAADISKLRPKGTGESDYALLYISSAVDGSPIPSSFPYIPYDVREAIAFPTDSVLLTGFPAEFAGGASRSSLYPSSVFTMIGDLLTFSERSVDIISLGSVVLAQSGSSGGAVVNLWGQLVGLITTTSEGETTATRELRAITLSYISRDLERKTGSTLQAFLNGDMASKTSAFMANEAPALAKQIINYIQ